MDDEQFKDYVIDVLKIFKEIDEIKEGSLEKFCELFYYEYGEFGEDEVYDKVCSEFDCVEIVCGGGKNVLFYFFILLSFFELILSGLGWQGL